MQQDWCVCKNLHRLYRWWWCGLSCRMLLRKRAGRFRRFAAANRHVHIRGCRNPEIIWVCGKTPRRAALQSCEYLRGWTLLPWLLQRRSQPCVCGSAKNVSWVEGEGRIACGSGEFYLYWKYESRRSICQFRPHLKCGYNRYPRSKPCRNRGSLTNSQIDQTVKRTHSRLWTLLSIRNCAKSWCAGNETF